MIWRMFALAFFALWMGSIAPITTHEQKLVDAVARGGAQELFDGLHYCVKHNKDLPFELTHTGFHLKNNLNGLKNYIVADYQTKNELIDLASSVIETERVYAQKGYYTFVHGQRRGYLFAERIYTFLWQLHENEPTTDFLFAHVKPLLTTQKERDAEDSMRAYLLKHGRKQGDAKMRQKLLFLNYGLFANLGDSSSSTAYYVSNNLNFGSTPISITARDAFDLLGYKKIYSRYQQEIEDLEKAYAKGSTGTILVVAIPSKDLHRYVYLCKSGSSGAGMGGVKRFITIKGIGSTDDIHVIMKAIRENPSSLDTDDLEFCMVMTQADGGLDPRTGIKVEAIMGGDKKTLAALQKKEKELYKKIQAEIEG